MNAGRIIAYIGAAITIFFGILFIWATFSPDGQPGWLIIGIISVAIGFVLIWVAGKQKPVPQGDQNVTLKIDLPANIGLDSLKCQSCGGALTGDNIKMVAGAPVVTCPYCGSTYQLKEDPKW
jgi:DNA-directed RNA polymerase subunit RPC12/RpoP